MAGIRTQVPRLSDLALSYTTKEKENTHLHGRIYTDQCVLCYV